MDRAETVTAPLSFEARAAGRLAVRFILDIAAIGRDGERMLDALLVAAVIDANTRPLLRDPALQAAYATLDRPPPDALRRPVSINALATSLRLPFETVRRHVKQLVARGFIVASGHGLCVPTHVIASPKFAAAAQARYVRVLQFHDELAAVGAIDPLSARPPPPEDPRAPVRAVGRILSDFFFRTIDALHAETPDPMTGLVLLEIARSSSEHLSPAQAESAMRAGWIPNAVRGPVRVAHIARRLGAPYETTRRHVGWLVERGFCQRVGAGVLTTEAYMARPDLAAVTAENHANVRRMFRQLAGLGAQLAATGAER